ncbi:MAG: YraN family protein [Tannerellaceae bacterium]|jgi:putative endonuclease|nr:YraN family protein [Tannerellaceae bacterium]
MTTKTLTGKKGEERAREYLIAQGYEILNRNWRLRHYEIDIIASKDNELVIVEVKTRSKDFLIAPEIAVGPAKIRRLAAAANAYARHFMIDMPVRFDIITLVIDGEEKYEIEHIEDAFLAPVSRR